MRRGWFLWGLAGVIAPRWTARKFEKARQEGLWAEQNRPFSDAGERYRARFLERNASDE